MEGAITHIDLYKEISDLCKEHSYSDPEYLSSILIQGLAKLKLIMKDDDVDTSKFNTELSNYVLTTSYIEYVSTHPVWLKSLRLLHHVATLYLVLSVKNRDLTVNSLRAIEVVNMISFLLVMSQQFDLLSEENKKRIRVLRFVAQTIIRSGIFYKALIELKYNYKDINALQIFLTLFLQIVGVNEVLFCYSTI